MSWSFEIVKPVNDGWPIVTIKEWRDLIETGECSHVFFHPAMAKAWLQTYKPLRKIEPFVIKATYGDNVALLPMAVWHRNWKNAFQTMIIPVGYSDFDYHDPLFRYRPTEKSLIDYWNGVIQVISDNFKYDTLTTDGITDSLTVDGPDWRIGEICPMLRLDEINSEDELMSFFKTSLRGDLRRQMRRLSESGELSFKEYTAWDEIPEDTFAEFMKQHSARWPNAYKAPKFHENLLREGLKAGVVHFSTLSVGDTEIAWHLGFSFKGRYYYYMPAGKQEFFKYSPTKVHLFYLVRRAVEQGYEIYDHLRGEETYKSGWSNDAQYVNTLYIKSIRLSSTIKANILRMRQQITPPAIRDNFLSISGVAA